jgi:hypothetical protein
MALLTAAAGHKQQQQQLQKLLHGKNDINRTISLQGFKLGELQLSKLQLLQVLWESPRVTSRQWLELCFKGKVGFMERGEGERAGLEQELQQQMRAVGRVAQKRAEAHKVRGLEVEVGALCNSYVQGPSHNPLLRSKHDHLA